MFKRISSVLAPPVFEGDEEKTRVARLANLILAALTVLISLAALLVVLVLKSYVVMGVIYVSMMSPLVIAWGILRRGHVFAASLIIVSSLWIVLVVTGLLVGGVINVSYATILLVIIISALLLGGPASLIVGALSILAVLWVYLIEMVGLLPPSLATNNAFSFLINHILNYLIASALLYLAMSNLTVALRRARQLDAELQAQQEQLQALIAQRTQDYERNARYLRATTLIANESAATMGDLQTFLARAVQVIGEQFGYYHVGLYMLDTLNEWAELRAVFGQGQQLLERGFRLRVGVQGMIGDVARRGVYRLARDVSRDFAYLYLDDIPDTQSELVVPLKAGDAVIGVLDVQSDQIDAFSEQDVQTIQAIADQIAIALNNARLFELAQQAIENERRLYRMQTTEAWQALLGAQQTLGFYSTTQATVPAVDLWKPEMKTALQTGHTALDAHDPYRLAVPIKVRDQVIGVVDFAKPTDRTRWTSEEISLVEALVERLGAALESARLYGDTQRRVVREQIVGQVSGRIRETLDMETMLRTAAEQIRQALNLEDLVVRLAMPDSATEQTVEQI